MSAFPVSEPEFRNRSELTLSGLLVDDPIHAAPSMAVRKGADCCHLTVSVGILRSSPGLRGGCAQGRFHTRDREPRPRVKPGRIDEGIPSTARKDSRLASAVCPGRRYLGDRAQNRSQAAMTGHRHRGRIACHAGAPGARLAQSCWNAPCWSCKANPASLSMTLSPSGKAWRSHDRLARQLGTSTRSSRRSLPMQRWRQKSCGNTGWWPGH